MPLAPHTCAADGCDRAVPAGYGSRCDAHRGPPRIKKPQPDHRPTRTRRGYDSVRWRPRRNDFLRRHPVCADCGRPSQVPDHDPVPRRELVALGVADPDADEHLVPRCRDCHNRRTARTGK